MRAIENKMNSDFISDLIFLYFFLKSEKKFYQYRDKINSLHVPTCSRIYFYKCSFLILLIYKH